MSRTIPHRRALGAIAARAGAVALAGALLAACDFAPPAPTLVAQPTDAPCSGDAQCVSGRCLGAAAGANGRCAECSVDATCGVGRRCAVDTGRCTSVTVDVPRHAGSLGGAERRNAEGRVHVGRVAVTPITAPEGPPR